MNICGFLKKNKRYIIPTLFFILSLIGFSILNQLNYTINGQAYFYTLSTISQTLAALIGVMGIVVIFRLQMLKSKQIEDTNRIRLFISSGIFEEEYPTGIDPSGNSSVILVGVKTLVKNNPPGETKIPELNEFNSIAKSLIDDDLKYKSYIKSISFPIFMATLAIIMSIIILPFGSIKLPDNNILPLGSPLFMVGLVVSITLAALFALMESFVELLMSDFD